MKRIFTAITIAAFSIMGISCSKEYDSPEDFGKKPIEAAKVEISTRGDLAEKSVTFFRKAAVYRTSGFEGQSWLCASSNGKMVHELFILSLYFESIDALDAGDIIDLTRCMFSFVLSSDIDATTYEYEGTIRLADKGSDFAVFHFDKVLFKCSFGEYLIDGYLNCPLLEEYEL